MAEAGSQVCTIKNPSRLKLRPWLISKLNGNDGYIPGLEWVITEQRTFKINWNHGGKSDWTKDKGQIFKEYAIQTGKYSEGVDRENFAKWKTNLRNALHKAEDIEQISSPHHLSQHNPCRIYRFKTIQQQQQQQQHQQSKTCRGKPSHVTTFKNKKSSGNSTPLPCAPLPLFVVPNCENSLEHMSIESVKLESETEESLGSLPEDLRNVSPLPFIQPAQNWNENLGFQMNIELLYKNNKIKQWQIMDPSGCLLFYEKELFIPEPFKPDHYGENFEQRKSLEMPMWPDSIGNEIAKDKANAVLNNCDRGIILECIGGNISIIRNCKTSVYTSSTTAHKINRDENHCKVKIFDFENNFLPKFEHFLKSEIDSPEANVIIYFGQDGNKLQTKETLVMARVTSCQAQNMIQQEVEKRQDYSSIHVSNSDTHDRFVQELNFSQLSIHNKSYCHE